MPLSFPSDRFDGHSSGTFSDEIIILYIYDKQREEMLEKERKLLIGSPSAEGCWKLQCMNIANKLIQFTLERFVFT